MDDSMARYLTQQASQDSGRQHRNNRTYCGVIEEAKYEAREKRAQRVGPQPWIARKLMVPITFGMMAYAAYVYIGRFSVPMLRRDADALGSRALGIVFLVVFVPFYLMMLWTYEKVVMTPPGFAKDHVPPCSQPLFPARAHRQSVNSMEAQNQSTHTIAGPPYEGMTPGSPPHTTVNLSRTHSRTSPTPHSTTRSSVAPNNSSRHIPPSYRSYSHRSHRSVSGQVATPSSQSHGRGELDDTVGLSSPPSAIDISQNTPPINPPPSSFRNHEHNLRASFDGRPPISTNESQISRRGIDRPTDDGLPPLMYSRYPPTTPVLLPEYRYCTHDRLVKPHRTHHCRSCGTCVLKYDHHCPWVGQCVGARNQKFFVNFLEWALLCCSWIFSTLVGLNAKGGISDFNFNLDPQHIVVIALAGLFILFCSAMLFTHVWLILLNQTTVENLRMQSMKDRERKVLSRLHRWWEFRAKRRTKKQWDQEWGRIDFEGNLWSLGDPKANWEAVMGQKWYEWILPIGRSAGDGVTYPTNPRFDEQGRWRRRKDWPKELQGT